MNRWRKRHAFFLLLISALPLPAAGQDARQKVALPAMMQEHMLNNMRDHLRALQEIQTALARHEFDKAADTAEQRLGMSSLEAHDAAHMAPYLPRPMQDIGTEMHRAASRFARTVQEAAVQGDLSPVLTGYSEVLQHCNACHAAYRIR